MPENRDAPPHNQAPPPRSEPASRTNSETLLRERSGLAVSREQNRKRSGRLNRSLLGGVKRWMVEGL